MNPTPRLHVRRALVHPAWLAALATLALNDHVLKGSGLIPSVITGKLSDVAGMLVAPVLLAVVAGVRTRRGFMIAHVLVGAVFSALQLSTVAAAGWSSLLGTFGISWVTTMDPTDLLALPALLLSLHLFGRLHATATGTLARNSLEYTAVAGGLMACAATSQVEGEPFRPSIFTDVYIHNSGDADMIIRVRRLADSVDIDCGLVAEDPGGLLQETLFGTAESWTVPAGVSHGLLLNDQWGDAGGVARECNVVLFDADNVAPRIIFWNDGDPAPHTVDDELFDPEDPGAIEIAFDDEGRGQYESGERFLFTPVVAPPVGGACAPQADGDRIAWSSVPNGTWTVGAMSRGLDGCWAVDLTDDATERLYLCAPLAELPFAEGDTVMINNAPLHGGSGGDWDALKITRDSTLVDAPATAVELHLVRGDLLPTVGELAFGLVPDFECGFAAESACGTVARAASLTVHADAFGSAVLEPGTNASLEAADGARFEVYLAHAQDRVVLDPICADGPDMLGTDLEVAVVFAPAAAAQ
jgi:hypothetical protein